MKPYFSRAGLFSFCLLISGCMVGPKYVKPTVPMAPAFKEQAPESFKESDGWKQAQPGDQQIRGQWWEVFHDPELNALEEEATVSNQELKAGRSPVPPGARHDSVQPFR